MFFSIPDTTEISAKESANQHAYTLFNIHLNGIHFCSLRYSQLRKFNDEFPSNLLIDIQPFPPKKFFNLSLHEIDERRLLLERYLQSIIQNKSIISSLYFNKFFLNAQHETIFNELNKNISLSIYFLNQHKIIIENFLSNYNTNQLFDECIKKISLTNEYSSYFSLFFFDQEFQLIRPLFSFESPYFSLKQIEKIHSNVFIVFKKSYWNLNNDLKLFDYRRTLKLVFLQCQYDIEQSKNFISNHIYDELIHYSDKHLYKEYILLSRTTKFYGYLFIKDCLMNDLITDKICSCLLIIGHNELICYFNNNDIKEISFKVTRIRCWKVNSIKNDMNISFEYLIKKDTLQWIILHTKQAPLISICLQSMIDEILATKMGLINPISILNISNNQTNLMNCLTTRKQSDLDRFNNNKLFDQGDGDDQL